MNNSLNDVEFKIDKDNLYREETYADFKMATIRCFVPVKADGSEDESRESIFLGTTQLMTPQGPIPIQGQLEGNTLEEAMANFPEAMKVALDKVYEEARRYQQSQRENESRIIVPGR